MAHSGTDYDLIVISTDSTGVEAAKKAALSGKSALLLQLHPGAIASVMCSTPVQGYDISNFSSQGVEAYFIEPDDTQFDSVSTTPMHSTETTSPHSVYILQSTESSTERSFENLLQEGETYFPLEEPEDTHEEKTSLETNTESHQEEEDIPPVTGSELLRERELHNRRRLIHRTPKNHQQPSTAEPTQNETPLSESAPSNHLYTKNHTTSLLSEPVFKERELNLRKRMSGSYRRKEPSFSIRSEKDELPNEPVTWKREQKKRPSTLPFQERSLKEKPVSPTQSISDDWELTKSSLGTPPTNESKTSKVSPKQSGQAEPQTPSVTSMESNHDELIQKEPVQKMAPFKLNPRKPTGNLQPFARKKEQSSLPAQDKEHIAGSIVWKAPSHPHDRKKHEDHQDESSAGSSSSVNKNTSVAEESSSSFQKMTYEPFSRNRKNQTGSQHSQAKGPLSTQPTPKSGKKSLESVIQDSSVSANSSYNPKTPTNQKKEPLEPSPSNKGLSPFMGEAARKILQNSTELKRDSIDIEDPYGQSYEDLLEPFAQNNPQSEQLEKRKIALRGLHNLINNLG
ncbi:hypothetical protein [Marininema halotolerans]|uniref:Uncharacterized protein n=1 Tax=Marininema halotolerans TaxID=1155944 RepID=A0A1I6PB20_9BACL|nr:hypothetical protein [Marininema halotolerans]SFS37288.1 hypothetical protein SAMN05444972_101469 [Marininema halotolerans]